MTIPENQLRTWSELGAQAGSQRTYESIRNALGRDAWPPDMGSPSVYLQGSYRNHTNIRGDSDVDVVVETSSVFYENLTAEERRLRGFSPGRFRWGDFRDEVYRSLADHYGQRTVRLGNKCIHVGAAGNRLNADVVPCCEFREYRGAGYAKGITFWTQAGVQIVNFPQLHYNNGTHKNEACGGNYKAMVRIFKNARNAAGADFPSYFLECLLYNVPSFRYSGTRQNMFHGILVALHGARSDGSMPQWMCQNGEQRIFGNAAHQIDLASAHRLVDALVRLWNTWR